MDSLLSLIDYTRLQDADTASKIQAFCEKALCLPTAVAAVCIYAAFVPTAKKILQNSAIKIATVANFPSGQANLALVRQEVRAGLLAGADEIDVVFPYQAFLAGEEAYCFDFIAQIKNSCPPAITLKVILESGAYTDLLQLKLAAVGVIKAGADFLKTSTGKIALGATLPAAEVLLQAIQAASRPVGLKVSGGIRTLDEAQAYIRLAAEKLGNSWVKPQNFRIGASQLVDVVLAKQS
jgi:deoxyribose-phosphate aldolase